MPYKPFDILVLFIGIIILISLLLFGIAAIEYKQSRLHQPTHKLP